MSNANNLPAATARRQGRRLAQRRRSFFNSTFLAARHFRVPEEDVIAAEYGEVPLTDEDFKQYSVRYSCSVEWLKYGVHVWSIDPPSEPDAKLPGDDDDKPPPDDPAPGPVPNPRPVSGAPGKEEKIPEPEMA